MASDNWGPGGGSNQHEAATNRSPRKNSLPGLVLLFVGLVGIVGGGIVKLTQPGTDTLPTDLSYWAPLIVLALGFLIAFIGLRLINSARGRKGLS